MTETEAIHVVFEQFTAETGFLLDLRMARGLNRDALTRVREACDTLQQIWAERDCVPKDIVVHLIDARTAVLSSWGLYPALQPELEALADEMMERVRRCLR